MLLLLRRILESSDSDHQLGYALVLANTSVIFVVVCVRGVSLDFRLEFLNVSDAVKGMDSRGSTCTISEQLCTIDLMRDVFPTPILRQ